MNFENNLKIGIGIYTPSEIARILRIPAYKVNRWINKYWDGRFGKSFNQKYSWSINNSKAVSFHTLIEFAVMMQFAEAGVKTSIVLKAHQELSVFFNTAFPFATKEVIEQIQTDGKRIFLENNKSIISLDGNKQFNLYFIKMFFKNIDFNEDNLAYRLWPLGKEKSILIDPERKFGHPVINGFNIYPETIFNLFKAGETKEYIAYLYDITTKQIQDAIDYCSVA